MIAAGSQCDGQRPCGRCKSQADVECVYKKPVRQPKENLRIEIDSLRLRQRPSDQVIAALVGSELWEEVLKRLRTGESVESISELLDAGFSPGASNPLKLAGFPPSNASPLSAQPMGSNMHGNVGQTAQADAAQGSPWNFSSQSQSGSTRRNLHPDVMNWTPDIGGLPQGHIASWADDMHWDPMGDNPPKYLGLEQVLSHINEPELQTPQRHQRQQPRAASAGVVLLLGVSDVCVVEQGALFERLSRRAAAVLLADPRQRAAGAGVPVLHAAHDAGGPNLQTSRQVGGALVLLPASRQSMI